MDPIEIANTLSRFVEDFDKLLEQYDKPGNQNLNYQKSFQYVTSPYAKKRDKTIYLIEILEEEEVYPFMENWKHVFLDKIIELFDKYKECHKLGLLKKKIKFYETTIIKITVDYDRIK